jgi:hypothetical protein
VEELTCGDSVWWWNWQAYSLNTVKVQLAPVMVDVINDLHCYSYIRSTSVKRLLSRVEVHVSCSQFAGVLRKFAVVSVCVTLFDTALKCIRISVDGYI